MARKEEALLIFDVVTILRAVERVHGGPKVEQHSC